jgi:hypothetical protein
MRWLRYASIETETCGFPQIAIGQTLLEVLFQTAQGEPAGLHTTQQRERHRAVGVDRELAGQIGLVIDGDRQHILVADGVVGLRRCGRRQQDQTGDDAKELSHRCLVP